MKKIYKRPICVTLNRLGKESSIYLWSRYFSNIENAITRGVMLALLTGEPGDVLEITSSNYGYLIATIKLKVNAKSVADLQVKFHVEQSLTVVRDKIYE